MALPPAEFARALLKEAQWTRPWLRHPLFLTICADGLLEAFVSRRA